MRYFSFFKSIALFVLIANCGFASAQADSATYLTDIKTELKKEWPKNRTINLVFHGHSVPSGYFKTPVVNSMQAYPFLVLKQVKERYPYAVVNVIVTAIGGENSVNGEKRFNDDVLTHKPDVLFIDYALNDKGLGVEKSTAALRKMIDAALKKGIKIILLTPSPHQNYDILNPENPYVAYQNEIIALAKAYHVGLVDSYTLFKEKIATGHPVTEYMSQVNHPNEAGHAIIAKGILKWF
jgi:acyl-CoA thioesterase-1